jgi:nucleotide-binding universal stress UspA family protein
MQSCPKEIHNGKRNTKEHPDSGRLFQVDVGLIVVGSHGRQGISRWVVGSVAERIVRHADCPVLVVR